MTGTTATHQQGVGNNDRSLRTPVIIAVVIVTLAAVATILFSLGAAETEAGTEAHAAPAIIEHIDGSELARITLTEQAAVRLDIQTAPTTARGAADAQRLVVPYSSLIYDAEGATWTYTSPEPLVFERVAVAVDSIRGDRVFLSEGPPAGTEVVVVGAAELFGAEFGVGH